MKLAFNLMSLPGNKIFGVGMFLREMCLHAQQELAARDATLTVFHHADCDPATLFNLAPSPRVRLHAVADVESRARRVAWEQLVLPRRLDGARLLYSPNNINPLCLAGQTRSVVTIHDLLSFDSITRFGRLQQFYLRSFTRASARRAARVITVSETSAREIRARLNLRPSAVDVVSNVVEPPAGIAQVPPDSRRTFVIVASVHADKRIDLALRGFKLFTERHPGYRLDILGSDQGALADLKALASELRLDGRVAFRGYVDDGAKWTALASCVALILFGRKEGFGIPVLEAMAVGRPSIVANDGALPEVVGDAGIVVDPEDSDQVAQALETIAIGDGIHADRIERRRSAFDPETQREKFWNLLFAAAT